MALLLPLCACGGGGSSPVQSPGSTPAPTSTTGTAPTPSTGTTGTGSGTGSGDSGGTTGTSAPATRSAEYLASGAVVGADAGYAYDRSITGMGVTVADIDTGIDQSNHEFTGRISADSKSFDSTAARCATCAAETVSFSLQDVQGHGTETASVMAAAADGIGMQGVAPGATILALKIAEPDLTGVTPTSGPIPEGNGANTGNVAPALVYAVDHGAFAISMSLNGTSTGQVAADQKAAMDYVAKNDRLVIESVSNNVGEDSFAAGQIASNLVGADLANKSWFLFGIRVDANHDAPSGNGVPGDLADRTLSVVADDVNVTEIGGGTAKATGNSFAAPAIAGAAALLKQYWPQLGGKAIATILLSSADDLGTPGVDQIYGVGLLDVAKAMQAQAPTLGTSSLSAQPLAGSSLTFGSAYGGGSGSATFSQIAGSVVVLDRFGRDYRVDAGALARAVSPGGLRAYGATLPTAMIATSPPLNQAGALALAGSTAEVGPHPVSGLPANGLFAFTIVGGGTVTGRVNGDIEGGGALTGSLLRGAGLQETGQSTTLAMQGYVFEFGAGTSSRPLGAATRSNVQRMLMQMPSGLRLGMTAAREWGSALGLAGTGAFRIDGGRSSFATIGWSGSLGGIAVTADAMVGRTAVATSSDLLRFAGPVLSIGFRAQAARSLFGGAASFGIASPLRVQSARVRLTLPSGYDPETQDLVTETQSANLAPHARELDFEAGWSGAITQRTAVRLGVAHAVGVGNVAGLASTAGFLSFTLD